jgi:hypothetical protein
MVMATIAGRLTLGPVLVLSEIERDNILVCLALRVLLRRAIGVKRIYGSIGSENI